MPATTYRLRLATPADAAPLLAVYSPYVTNSAVTFEYEVPSAEEFAERIRKVEGILPWLAAEAAGKLVGYAYASPYRGRPAYQWSVETSVYVQAAHHGTGVARQLYSRLFALLRRQGYVNAYAGILCPNPKSEAFHHFFGFHSIGTYRHVGYKFDQWYDVQWLAKQLQDLPVAPVPPTPLAALPQLYSKPHSNG